MRNVVVLLTACFLAAPAAILAAAPEAPAEPNPAAEIHGIDPSNLDRSVQPCLDFFQFATGGWQAKNPIPPAFPRWGTFDALQERNQEQLRGILESCAKDTTAPKGSLIQRLGDFYATAMDEALADKLGAEPLKPELERIAAVKDADGLAREVARLQRMGVSVLFGFGSEVDAKDATKMIAGVSQAGLGLPDRDYYLNNDDKTKKIREAYLAHVQKVFELLGDEAGTAAAEAQTVMKLETGLAEVSMTRVERRDPQATYNPMSVSEFAALAPGFPWSLYLGDLGVKDLQSLNVSQPKFFKGLSAQIKAEDLAAWKTYLRWHLARAYSPYLSSTFVKENFEYSKVFTGTQEDLPRWRKAVAATNGALGEDLGQLYVKQYFPPEAKAKALDLLHNIKKALREDLQTLSWMSEPTRGQALVKLDRMAEKIGYPEKWKDYSKVKIGRTSYVANVRAAREFDFQDDLDKIGKPVDRTEWHMTPPTVNAYYSPTRNEIVFPAGILQPPFFDPKADDAVNYGAIGVVMGHEITHGFDDKGSQFDADGNLKNWWTADDLKRFNAKGDLVAEQASAYVVDGDLHLNGKLVEGEAIADLGGVTLAYRAYHLAADGKGAPAVDGFTGDQRFFLGFANVWASQIRPAYARMLATLDPHPPARYRVNETLANIPAFAKAFGCQAGSPLVSAKAGEREIW
jgi:putative endopeptidase